MRVVILCSSVYSETACATAVRLAELGYVPSGALSLSTLSRGTLLRKFAQWGVRDVARYARTKLFARHSEGRPQTHNPELQPFLHHGRKTFRSLRDVASFYRFPVALCDDQNSPAAIERLKAWAPDLMIFTGGNILRRPLLDLPRLGVLNTHLALLPEIRGMSSPEWSLLKRVPLGITIHYIDEGIDTGPILKKCQFDDLAKCGSLPDLRNRLIAFGVEKIGEVVSALDRGMLVSTPQSNVTQDNQFFVMHEWLQARAAKCLVQSRVSAPAGVVNG
jgi:folate-dependent phosphoribosylglycinamide formyltransferase PurN